MDIGKCVNKNKEIYNAFLQFIESEETIDYNVYFQNLIDQIETPEFMNERDNTLEVLQMISNISTNYHRDRDFLSKIERIIFHLAENIKQKFTCFEIFYIFKSNKQLLLYLLNNHIMLVDDSILKYILIQTPNIFNDEEFEKIDKKRRCYYYDIFFYPEIKDQIDEAMRGEIEQRIMELDPTILKNFDEKRKIGENENYACEMIRNDSVKDFIKYVNKTNLSLYSTKVKTSVFETNASFVRWFNFIFFKKMNQLLHYGYMQFMVKMLS